jgi:beta-lactamase class A
LWIGAITHTKFPFTNPALNYAELAQSITQAKTLDISSQIDAYTKKKEAAWDITHLSVYFRNLNNGGWFGVEGKEYFSPASLMKLPILISYVKKSESEPWLLDKQIVYKKDHNLPDYEQNIPPEHQLVEGKSYTLREVLQYLIIYSDNNASALLEANLPMADLQKTFTDIWLTFPVITSWSFDNNIRVIDYASFFRQLFNASYLNRVDSEKVLNLLTKVKFKDGLVGWIPSGITVAHKFWERGILWANGREEKQLHDCGIVYYPSHPYIICVMTKWYDWKNLRWVIWDVSDIIYSETEKNYWDTVDSE